MKNPYIFIDGSGDGILDREHKKKSVCVYIYYYYNIEKKFEDHSCMSDGEDVEGKIMYSSKT